MKYSLLLPNNWEEKELKALILDIQYGYTASSSEDEVGPKLLRITDLQNNSVNWQTVPYCECDQIDKYRLERNNIVIARTGATTGKSYLLKEIPHNAIFASYLIRLKLSSIYPAEYLAWFMQSPSYWQQITTVSKGSAQPGANATILSKLSIPIPPLNEQRRIVAKIEELTTHSKRAREALEDIPTLIEQLVQAIRSRCRLQR